MRLPLWVDRALLSLFDPACPACGAALADRRGTPVCGRCWAAVCQPTPPVCARCGDPLRTWRAGPQACTACIKFPPSFDAARASAVYAGPLREIVHALKYRGLTGVATPLGHLMRGVASDWLAEPGLIAVPVPLHPWRSLRRGFNQADALAVQLDIPVRRLLRRRRLGRAQAGLHAADRRTNVTGLFAIRRLWGRAMPSHVLLIDDVMTTGATASECARVLKAAGVKSVRVLTAARTVTRAG